MEVNLIEQEKEQGERLFKIKTQLLNEYKRVVNHSFDDLTNVKIYNTHATILNHCGDIIMAKQFKNFLIDDRNRDVLKFLLYYFNNNKLAETVFPDEDYKIHKNLMLCGPVGVGKTMLMQVFSKYLEVTKNINSFVNLSVTQMVNYYKMNNHLDRYTFNEKGSDKFDGNPLNMCLNDIGMQTHLHFGTDTKVLVIDFLLARNEIWTQTGKTAHITTNLTVPELKEYFDDGVGRMSDRFKTYNVINLDGESRR